MSDANPIAQDPENGSSTKNAMAPWPVWARKPFPHFSHLGGVALGTIAGLSGALACILSPELNILLVPVLVLGILNPILLSLLVSMPQTGRAVLLLGGLALGGLAGGAAWFAATDPGITPDVFAQMARPLSAASLFLLLGAGPVAVVLALPKVPGSRWLVRLVAATFAAGLAAVAGMVVFGLLAGMARNLPQSFTLLIAVVVASYILFHLQLLCILDTGGLQQEELEVSS